MVSMYLNLVYVEM